MSERQKTVNDLLRSLPSVDLLLQTNTARALRLTLGAEQLGDLVRKVTEELRQEILAAQSDAAASRGNLLAEAERRLTRAHEIESKAGIRRVINATGVILHTNLGRAPLSAAARAAINEEAAGYCGLEYDSTTGTRGRRGGRVEDLLARLTGAEAALIVNNCAAAALLVLTVLAREGEAIISRGELVEIGGDFRVPDVMAQSGTRMIEVGTTNRTRLSDYRKAISPQTRLLMRVHTSNYRIVGFTKNVEIGELVNLAHDNGLLFYEDAGSGALANFSEYGISGEPLIRDSIAAGVDVVSFSSDKLLGGPQAGLLVGRAEVVERLRRHPLQRALRADKLRLAALEATLDAFARGASSTEVPTHRMIAATAAEVGERANGFRARLQLAADSGLRVEIVPGESAIGGGAAPTSHLATTLLSLSHDRLGPNQIAASLRNASPPVIGRIEGDCVLLDLRTVSERDEPDLERAVSSLTG